MSAETTGQEFFEHKYCVDQDPWGFASKPYELDRYAAILRALSHRRYRRAFEPGCSIGVLTVQLAGICDAVEAMDIAPSAARQAQDRCRALAHVNVSCGTLQQFPHADRFDLIVLSEIGYYFEEDELERLAKNLVAGLSVSGVLLAAHWLGVSEDHLLHGNQVHEVLRSLDGLELEYSEQHPGFRLDRWVKIDG